MNIHNILSIFKKEENKLNKRERMLIEVHSIHHKMENNPPIKKTHPPPVKQNPESLTLVSPIVFTPHVLNIKPPDIKPPDIKMPDIKMPDINIFIPVPPANSIPVPPANSIPVPPESIPIPPESIPVPPTLKELLEVNEKIKQQVIETVQSLESPKESLKEVLYETYINVYQTRYKGNHLSTGLGDFLRGCYCLFQYCDIHNYKYDVLINHQIAKYLKNTQSFFDRYPDITTDKYKNIFNNIVKFENSNFNTNILPNNIVSYKNNPSFDKAFENYIKSKVTFNKKNFIYTIAYPNIHRKITQEHRIYIQKIMECNDDVINDVKYILSTLQLENSNYTLIHIRCGDKYLIPGYTQPKHLSNYKDTKKILFNRVKNELSAVCNPSVKYLLLADNNYIKKEVVTAFPFIKTWYHEICHMGEGQNVKDISAKNNLVDFNLISKSSNIISYTVYEHGSGFSKWCAETYSIPHTCKYLK